MDATLTHIPPSLKVYEAALEGLSRINEAMYRQDATLPEIHAAGVRYRRERGEAWRHAMDVVGEGWGDCEDLAAARVGWLRARGGDRNARVIVKRTGPHVTHALVRRGNGVIEDPSKDLGMGTPDGAITMDGFTNEELGFVPGSILRRAKAAAMKKAKAKAKANARRASTPPPRASASTRAVAPAAPEEAEAREEAGPEVAPRRGDNPAPAAPPIVLTSFPDQYADEDYGDEHDDGEDFEEIGADPSDSVDISWVVERTDTGYRGTVRVPLDAGRMLLVSRTAPKKDEAKGKALAAASKVITNPAVAALIPPQARFALNLVQSKTARNIAKKLLKLF